MTLYMCVSNTTQSLNAATPIKLDRSIWIPFIGGTPLML
ncbi:hypothetical protein phiAS5_ORF0155 [Aeromonas phage phiAS5]|uniref:Uncharacterized protein n=1 Tax=Aeromonas phage phiAS5 TaxID=879630 RepID=E1A2Q2_9CAUD|nr:hypothetical protein phiAS5_ORF0155 [Aeromonas phage phiAS5]ADM79998.1 hypothetical protein phiAS5_ORF0155 [Aeromonas phage phiAS5]